MSLHQSKDEDDLAMLRTYFYRPSTSFKSLYHCKVNSILALKQRLGYLSRYGTGNCKMAYSIFIKSTFLACSLLEYTWLSNSDTLKILEPTLVHFYNKETYQQQWYHQPAVITGQLVMAIKC
jgi:hypothetical protein